MDQSDPYTTNNSSPEMSDDEGWVDDDLDTVMQAAATLAGPSTSTALYSGNHTLSTASSSSSSSPGPGSAASKKKKAQGLRKVSKTSSAGKKRMFTPKMQERQARGTTNVMSSDDDSSDNNFDPNYNPYETAETWEQKQRRRLAAVILDSPELLMMHAQARSDSIPGTRHYFTKILCGYQDPENEYPFAKSFQEEREGKARMGKKARYSNSNVSPQQGGGAAAGGS